MSAVTDDIERQGIIAIVRSSSAEAALVTSRALVAAGLVAVEVSLVTPDALEVVRTLVAEVPACVHIGVGTVISIDELYRSVGVGASFAVAPISNEAVIRAAVKLGIDIFPGAATPTEAVRAAQWGASLVKLFPASLWSPAALKEMLTALPWLRTVPTGGVTLEAAPAWIGAGATALGIGGALSHSDSPGTVARDLSEAIAAARRG